MANKNKVNKRINKEKEILTDEQTEIRNFIIILITIIILIVAIFFFTKYVINDGDVRLPESTSLSGDINYDLVSVGTMLNKNDEEYYVLAYDFESVKAPYYSNLANTYIVSSESLPLYFIKTNDVINKEYLLIDNEEENVEPENISELKLGEVTLMSIKGGKIIEYYNDIEAIQNVLKES